MKKLLLVLPVFALLLAGCQSYSVLTPWDDSVAAEDGEKPIATFATENVSYRLFGLVPISSGIAPTAANSTFDKKGVSTPTGIAWGADRANVDGCLDSLRFALAECKTSRVDHVRWSEWNDWSWSLFILRRHHAALTCTILPPEAK